MVILLIGVNDLSLRLLERDGDYRALSEEPPEYQDELLKHAFSRVPVTDPFYKPVAVWRTMGEMKELLLSSMRKILIQVQDVGGQYIVEARKRRKNAVRVRETLPDLTSALEEYSQNIHKIIDTAQSKGISIILMTQPSMWKPNLPTELEDLLWGGRVGDIKEEGNEYYSVTALADGMEMYNKTLLKVCNERDIDCIDLASLLQKDTTVFYDDVHFNEGGAGEIVRAIVQNLLGSGAFQSSQISVGGRNQTAATVF